MQGTGAFFANRLPLGLSEVLKREQAASAGRHLEYASLLPLGVDHGAHVQGLDQLAVRNVLRELLDSLAVLDPADILLAEDEFVEGNVPRTVQNDLQLRHG